MGVAFQRCGSSPSELLSCWQLLWLQATEEKAIMGT